MKPIVPQRITLGETAETIAPLETTFGELAKIPAPLETTFGEIVEKTALAWKAEIRIAPATHR